MLCIDDDPDAQLIVKLSLERIGGIRLHTCVDPHHAVQRTREVAPDLILLDFLMPGLDGVTLFRRLQADPDLGRIPVVFLTASAPGHASRALQSLGAAGVLFKPFGVRELPRKLAEIWAALDSAACNR